MGLDKETESESCAEDSTDMSAEAPRETTVSTSNTTNEFSGCSASMAGVAGVISSLVCAAAVALLKKREDD